MQIKSRVWKRKYFATVRKCESEIGPQVPLAAFCLLQVGLLEAGNSVLEAAGK